MLKPADNWRDAMEGVSADIDDEFGEAFLLTPVTTRPNYQPEPSGPPVLITGVFRDRSAEGLGVHGNSAHAMEGGLHVDSRQPIVSFDRDRLPFPPEDGTWVKRLATGSLYEVARSLPDGVSRVVCHLNQLGLPEPT